MFRIGHHPIRARALSRLLLGRPFAGAGATIRQLVAGIPLVTLRPCTLAASAIHGVTARR